MSSSSSTEGGLSAAGCDEFDVSVVAGLTAGAGAGFFSSHRQSSSLSQSPRRKRPITMDATHEPTNQDPNTHATERIASRASGEDLATFPLPSSRRGRADARTERDSPRFSPAPKGY